MTKILYVDDIQVDLSYNLLHNNANEEVHYFLMRTIYLYKSRHLIFENRFIDPIYNNTVPPTPLENSALIYRSYLEEKCRITSQILSKDR